MFKFFTFNKVQPAPIPGESKEPGPEYSYCETATAAATTPWHIRELTEAGKKLGGGADTPALCGRKVSWDLNTVVRDLNYEFVCKECRKRLLDSIK
jgi:hypothetical protein